MEILRNLQGQRPGGHRIRAAVRLCTLNPGAKGPPGAWSADDYVTLTDGTGIVHIAPAFGEDDARVGRANDLPFVQLVDDGGVMDERTPWAGLFVKKRTSHILMKHLAGTGLLLKTERHLHNYPFCWRCDTPLLYYARSTWFIRMTAVKGPAEANEPVGQLDAGEHQGRPHGQLYRKRGGLGPLPRALLGHAAAGVDLRGPAATAHLIGSVAELKKMSAAGDVPDGIELHRPYIDQVTLKCEKCGGVMKRASGGHRLLVRFRLHALRPVALPL